jgi:phytoene dehydrogenase-like protein
LRLLRPDIAFANAFPDGRSVVMHAAVEQTCASIAAISPSDADAWRALFLQWSAAKDAIAAGLNAPPGPQSAELAALEHEPGGLDQYRFSIQSLRSWSGEQFTDEHIRLFLGAFSLHANVAPDEVGGGQLAWLFDSIIQEFGNQVVEGGMAGVPDALARCLAEHGGSSAAKWCRRGSWSHRTSIRARWCSTSSDATWSATPSRGRWGATSGATRSW